MSDTPSKFSILDALRRKTDPTVPVPVQPSVESSKPNSSPMARTSLPELKPALGGPKEAIGNVELGLVDVARKLQNTDLTDGNISALRKFIDRNSRGFIGSLPMVCRGGSCPFLSICVLHEQGLQLPVGSKCPLEESLGYLYVNKHLKALGIEDIDSPENSFDMDMLYELAGQELIRWRCGVLLSKNPDLTIEQQSGETLSGEPLFIEIMNPVIEIMDKAGRSIGKIREALVATRRAQVVAGQVAMDASQRSAELKEKAMSISKARANAAREKVKDVEFTVKDSAKTDG